MEFGVFLLSPGVRDVAACPDVCLAASVKFNVEAISNINVFWNQL